MKIEHIKNFKESQLEIHSKNIIVCSDWHIPYNNHKWVNKLYKTAKENGIRDIAIIGDFWDCDYFSPFAKTEAEVRFDEEIVFVREELKRLTKNFDNVYFTMGNHELRWQRWSGGHLNLKHLYSLTRIIDGYEVTELDHMVLSVGKEKWRLSHPTDFSRIPLRKASTYASKYLMNIANAHGHYCANGWDISREFRLVDLGGLFDKDKIPYLSRTSSYPLIDNGFLLFKDGKSRLIDEL